ncbi:SCO3242 family prenyltransferase [Streptomyces zagrosensis]|uniref:4-hydroxybenzoate polyprenyltransferase n=1 Tax=Streptomyces zagrosensis TaxID=1042984 RepID=A0A7W9QIU0_9ACTN|nr:UbiA family prenyltransferase [Streptomyces zagrosensis]MBB5939742.1 4-hydroxybenzoate polyprenyltransferase [Streptomyces zagrosensis]
MAKQPTSARPCWLPTAGAVAQLVRAPAALTTPGDTLAGAAAAGRACTSKTPLLCLSSACLYWAGMALNDYADREADAAERPERPIPSGRIKPAFALALATTLTATGLALAQAGGGARAVAVAAPLAGTVWVYDLATKSHPLAGPLTMAAARALDVLLGAGYGRLRTAAPAAALLGAHTLVVCALSRHEVHGMASPPLATVVCTGAVAALAGRPSGAGPGGDGHRTLGLAALAVYAAGFAGAQAIVVRRDPRSVRRAVTAGILGTLPLQAACSARAGRAPAAAALLAAVPLVWALSRQVSPT